MISSPICTLAATKTPNNPAEFNPTGRIIRVVETSRSQAQTCSELGMNLPPLLHFVLRSSLFWTLCGIASLSATVHSQEPINLGHQSWSTENGLPQNSVHRVFQSR